MKRTAMAALPFLLLAGCATSAMQATESAGTQAATAPDMAQADNALDVPEAARVDPAKWPAPT
ncbi:MAG: hypothetical protein EOO78_37605, partial [Oxalobacteraceae bacterium]